MVEGWFLVLAAVVSAVLGYAAHVLQGRIPSKDNQDAISDAQRAEALEHFRWAAELAVSEDETQRRLGADQLQVLIGDPHLRPEDLRRVRAAIHSALASRIASWDHASDSSDVGTT
ncbi:MAG: hypothetical protein WA962_01185 [Ornithinimicrobium sp.]